MNAATIYGLFILSLVTKGTYHVYMGNFDQKRTLSHLMWLGIGSVVYIFATLWLNKS